MPQYLLSVHHDDAALAAAQASISEEDMAAVFADVEALHQGLEASGSLVLAGALQPVAVARVVRAAADEVSITDGPFVRAKEHLGGFWIIQAPDAAAVEAVAARASAACRQPIEVRPFQDG